MRARILILAPLIMGLAACGSDMSSTESGTMEVAPEAAQDANVPGGASAGGGADARGAQEPLPAAAPGTATDEDPDGGGASEAEDTDRFIREGSLTLRVEDLQEDAERIRTRIREENGEITFENINLGGGQDTLRGYTENSYDENPEPYEMDSGYVPAPREGEGVIIVSVPTEATLDFIDTMADEGEELRRGNTSENVERQLVDLESRIETQRRSVERVRELLEQATTIQEIITIEGELAQREADLESLLRQSESLGGKASVGTVTITLTENDTFETTGDESPALEALKDSWDIFQRSLGSLILILAGVLPYAVVGGVVYLLIRRLFQKRRSRRHARAHEGHPAPHADPQGPRRPMPPQGPSRVLSEPMRTRPVVDTTRPENMSSTESTEGPEGPEGPGSTGTKVP